MYVCLLIEIEVVNVISPHTMCMCGCFMTVQLIEIEVVDGASQAVVPLDGANEEGWKTGYQVRRDYLHICI
jgi:hypothetical protein